MKLWFLGDSVFSPVVQSIADALGMDLVDSSIPEATIEHTRVMQTRAFSGQQETVVAVIYLDKLSYDGEIVVAKILRRVADNSRIALVVIPAGAKAAESMKAHWRGNRFITIEADSFGEAKTALLEALR